MNDENHSRFSATALRVFHIATPTVSGVSLHETVNMSYSTSAYLMFQTMWPSPNVSMTFKLKSENKKNVTDDGRTIEPFTIMCYRHKYSSITERRACEEIARQNCRKCRPTCMSILTELYKRQTNTLATSIAVSHSNRLMSVCLCVCLSVRVSYNNH